MTGLGYTAPAVLAVLDASAATLSPRAIKQAVGGTARDFGAEGIIAPMINTAADARAFAAAAKYPPVGERSWGPHSVTSLAGLADQSLYLREANDNVITLAMIETRTALATLEAIVETPGIDGLFLGPSDLSIALKSRLIT